MKRIMLTLAILAAGKCLFAQTPPANTPAPDNTPAATNAGNPGSAIGLIISTDGVGLQFAQNLFYKKTLAIRVGASYFPINLTNFEYAVSGSTLVMNGKVNLGAINAMLDFHPFNNGFKLTGGIAYMLVKADINALPKDSAKLGDIVLSPKEQGEIIVGVTLGPICPYMGIGFGKAVPKSRFSFNFEVGTYYIKQPKLTFQATGMLEPTSSQEPVLQENIKGYSWLPMVNLGFNFKLSK